MLFVGELSAFFLLMQLGFIVALLGIILSFGGISLLRVTFIPIAFLVFAIPLPYFLDFRTVVSPSVNLVTARRVLHQAIWSSRLSDW